MSSSYGIELRITGSDFSEVARSVDAWEIKVSDNTECAKSIVAPFVVSYDNNNTCIQTWEYCLKHVMEHVGFEDPNEFKEALEVFSDQELIEGSEIPENCFPEIRKYADGGYDSRKESLIYFYKLLADDLYSYVARDKNGIMQIGRRISNDSDDDKQYFLSTKFDDNKLRFGNLVGTIRKDYSYREFIDKFGVPLHYEIKKILEKRIRVILEIKSRFDSDMNHPYFLLTMLTKGNLIMNENEIQDNTESVLDCLLLWRLRTHLLNACQKGLYQTYHSFEENGDRLRGTIDFARHIKTNIGQKNGRIAYSYREKTFDNYINHLVLTAYEHLKRNYPSLVAYNLDSDPDIHQAVNLLYQELSFPQYSSKELLQKCLAPISHPYYTEFEDLRHTCCSILRGEGFSLFGGEGEDVRGILYYIPDLWEEYLESEMIGISMSAQKPLWVLDGKQKMKADYIFTKNKKPYCVLDAKFKPSWYMFHSDGKVDRLLSDYRECLSYMDSINVCSTGTIFPYHCDSGKVEYPKIHDVVDNKTDIYLYADKRFYTFPIGIPAVNENEKYPAWKTRLDNTVKTGMDNLRKCIAVEEEYLQCRRELEKKLNSIADGSDDVTSTRDVLVRLRELRDKRQNGSIFTQILSHPI